MKPCACSYLYVFGLRRLEKGENIVTSETSDVIFFHAGLIPYHRACFGQLTFTIYEDNSALYKSFTRAHTCHPMTWTIENEILRARNGRNIYTHRIFQGGTLKTFTICTQIVTAN